METNEFSIEGQEMGPIPLAEILQAVLARYALAGTLPEDAVARPARQAVSTITVVVVGS